MHCRTEQITSILEDFFGNEVLKLNFIFWRTENKHGKGEGELHYTGLELEISVSML